MLDRHGHSQAAEAAARLAIRRDPYCASSWETLGTILVQRGTLEESCDCYATAVRIEPTFAHAINNLAVTLDRMGQLESAEERYRQGLPPGPQRAPNPPNRATLPGGLGRYQEALAIAQKVRDRRPNMMRAQSLVTEFKDILKRRNAAQRQMKRTGANRPK